MEKFEVCFTEYLVKYVTIEAENESEAEKIARRMYRNEEIVLDSDDYWKYELEVL